MSAVDGGGGRLVWIAKPQPNHGLQVIQAMLQDRDGLLRIGGIHMRRKELRKMAQDIKQQHDVSMIAIPWEYADQMIYEAYERAKARGQSGLENFHELRSLIGTGKPKEQPHPIYKKLDAAEAREGAWRELSRRLLDEPELRYWILTDDWVQVFFRCCKKRDQPARVESAAKGRALQRHRTGRRESSVRRRERQSIPTAHGRHGILFFRNQPRRSRQAFYRRCAASWRRRSGTARCFFPYWFDAKELRFLIVAAEGQKEDEQSGMIIKP